MRSAVAAFYLDVAEELNPLACLVYLHGLSGLERQKSLESFLHIPSKECLLGVEVNNIGDYGCGMCLSICKQVDNNIAQSAVQMLTDILGWDEHTPQCTLLSSVSTFIMIFIPYKCLMPFLV